MTACLRPDVQRAADQRLLVQEAGRGSTHQICSRDLAMPRVGDEPDQRRTWESTHSWLLWPFY